MSATGRMGIGVVGDSPAGATVAHALAAAGHALVGRSVPPEDRAEQVDVVLPGVPVLDLHDILRRSELVIIAADGEALDTLVERIDTEGLVQPGQLVAHLALDRGLEVFRPLQQQGVIPLRLYPMIPFTGTSIDLVRLRGGFCAVSAPAPVLAIAQALAIEMGMEPVVLDDSQQQVFHEVVSRITAESLGFVYDAVTQLDDAGVDQAGPALASLVRAAVDQALREKTPETDLLGEAAALFAEEESRDDS